VDTALLERTAHATYCPQRRKSYLYMYPAVPAR
jgi:hypothetical protein